MAAQKRDSILSKRSNSPQEVPQILQRTYIYCSLLWDDSTETNEHLEMVTEDDSATLPATKLARRNTIFKLDILCKVCTIYTTILWLK
jgi:hypothetical protein